MSSPAYSTESSISSDQDSRSEYTLSPGSPPSVVSSPSHSENSIVNSPLGSSSPHHHSQSPNNSPCRSPNHSPSHSSSGGDTPVYHSQTPWSPQLPVGGTVPSHSRVLVGFIGNIGSGKSTASQYVVDNWGFTELAFAQPLKEAAKVMAGLTHHQLYVSKEEVDPFWGFSPRFFMQQLGGFARSIDEAFWIKRLCHKLLSQEMEGVDVVISDVRYHNEVDAVHNNGGIVIKLIRDNTENQLNDQTIAHSSETELLSINGDYTIHNNGTLQDLFNAVDAIIRSRIFP